MHSIFAVFFIALAPFHSPTIQTHVEEFHVCLLHEFPSMKRFRRVGVQVECSAKVDSRMAVTYAFEYLKKSRRGDVRSLVYVITPGNGPDAEQLLNKTWLIGFINQ